MIVLALLCGSALLGEVALRGAEFRYPSAAERDVVWSPGRDLELRERRLYQRDERQIWKPLPGAELPWARPERLDGAGFRGAGVPLARTRGTVRIAILGSDEALGVGLARELTWPDLLRRAIEARGGQAEILCAAVEGSTLRQGIERWRADVRPYHPDLLLCTFAGEMESRAANRACSDSQRILDNGGRGFPDGSDVPAGPERMLRGARLGQCGLWIADVLDGDYWSWRAAELESRRLQLGQDRFDSAGTRRVSPQEFCGLALQLRDEAEAEHVRLILFPIPGEQTVRSESGAVRDYQALLLQTAIRERIPKLPALERIDGALRAGARVEDLYGAGRLGAGGQQFLADEIGRAIIPRLSELDH